MKPAKQIYQSLYGFMTQVTQLGQITSCLLLSLGPIVIFGAIKYSQLKDYIYISLAHKNYVWSYD